MLARRWQDVIPPVALPAGLRASVSAVLHPNLAQRFAREEILGSYRSKVKVALAEAYAREAGTKPNFYHVPSSLAATGMRVANSWDNAFWNLRSTHQTLQRAKVDRAFDEQEIRDYAENYATRAADRRTLEERREFALRIGVDVSLLDDYSEPGQLARLIDPQWWRRQLRKIWTRRAENSFRELGFVRQGREPYASEGAVRARRAQQERNRRFLETHVMQNEQGEQLKLLDIAERSLANPALRRGEFMVRARGFEEVAKELDHAAEFWTLTAPSAFHAQTKGGGVNERWTTAGKPQVRDAQAWLRKMWARARAKLGRLSIHVYGFRIAEPHHDGTPHWHLLLFMPRHHVDTVRRVLRGIWLSEYAHEPGAQDVRAKVIEIDSAKGSAVGYIAKYVSKNIDGAGTIGAAVDDETGQEVADGIARVGAWAAIHGIRQFQQIGGPPVGMWRELRRLREPLGDGKLEPVRSAASEKSDWAGFIRELGGLDRAVRRVTCVQTKYARTITRYPSVIGYRLHSRQWARKCGPRVAGKKRLARPDEMPAAWVDRGAPKLVDRQGRVVYASTKYGEESALRAVGVVAFSDIGTYRSAATRPHMWRMQRCEVIPLHKGSAVMNPPTSAAPGVEARNRSSDHGTGLGETHEGAHSSRPLDAPPPSSVLGPCPEGCRYCARERKFEFSGSGSFSGLGPVALTVRDTSEPPREPDTRTNDAMPGKLPRAGPDSDDG